MGAPANPGTNLRISSDLPSSLAVRYGAEAPSVIASAQCDRPTDKVAEGIDVTRAEFEFAVTHEGANVDDILDRRTRIGLVAADRERRPPPRLPNFQTAEQTENARHAARRAPFSRSREKGQQRGCSYGDRGERAPGQCLGQARPRCRVDLLVDHADLDGGVHAAAIRSCSAASPSQRLVRTPVPRPASACAGCRRPPSRP